MPNSNALREPEAAEYLGVSTAYLRQSRSRGSRTDGPPWIKMGRTVVYRVDDLDAFLEKHRVEPAESVVSVERAGSDAGDADAGDRDDFTTNTNARDVEPRERGESGR